MTSTDVWAATFAALTGSNVLCCAHMLRPRHLKWIEAPAPVRVTLSVIALVLMMRGISILFGSHANSAEGMIYATEALGSFVLLWHLDRNGRRAGVRRQAIAHEVALVMDLSGPPARYPGERQ